MKITREINGLNVEIELTNIELYDAYIEKQREYDAEDVLAYLQENEYPLDRFTDDIVQEIAMRSRAIQDASDPMGLALWNAVEYAVRSYVEENQEEE